MKHFFKLLPLLFLCQHVSLAADRPSFVVYPYLQWTTQNSTYIKWETAQPSTGWVEYGKAAFDVKSPSLSQRANGGKGVLLQVVNLEGLETETEYFYRAAVVVGKDTIYSPVYPFKTAVNDDTPIGFAVFSDSQGKPNPTVWGKIANLAERERPNFAIHTGDQVDNGHNRSDWLGHFFPWGQSFMSKYPIYAVAGNHENDAPNFYRYLGHPDSTSFITFKHGNTQFFMFDSNKDISVGSEIYQQLESALAKSTATWKIVGHHHPPYSSDENDYGDTKVAKSTLGSKKLAHLPALYDKYNVDVVFYGHIHTYERTWPLRNNKIDLEKGTIYVTVGGNGGGLENPAPLRSWFTNKIKMDHHFGFVRVAGGELYFQAIDADGRVFDHFELKKPGK